MRTRPISLCYYPTTVMLLDDKKAFLEKLELSLINQCPTLIYDSSEKALEFLKSKYQSKVFIDQCSSAGEDAAPDHVNQDINIRNIRKIIYFPERFSEISTLVIDYAMPKINGIEFSRQIKQIHPHIKIILLTGEAGHSLAVEAFNAGIIDKFLRKDEQNIIDILTQSIHELQEKYFSELSEICINSVSRLKELYILNDPVFIQLFEKTCKENKIVEYYLLDNQGSFLFLDEKANASLLGIKSEDEIKGLIAHAEFEDAPSDSVIEILKSKKHIPFFYSDKDLESTPSQWEKYFHPAKKLSGKNTYYYAYVNNLNAYDIQPEKILSYRKYLEAQ